MATEVYMPRLTHDMTKGRLLRWLKNEGDTVNQGDVLFEVETDKAVSEVLAEASGRLLSITYHENQEVPVGAIMAFIVEEGEEIPSMIVSMPQFNAEEISRIDHIPTAKTQYEEDNNQGSSSERRLFVTPIARKLIRQHNISIDQLKGSGPRGKIIEADILQYLRQQENRETVINVAQSELEFELVELSEIQRITGQRMIQSATTIPQFMLEVDVSTEGVFHLREFLKAQLGIDISFTSFLVKATASSLKLHSRLNASLVDGHIHIYKQINIGVATATNHGLVAPVVHNADTLTLAQIQERIDYFQRQAGSKGFTLQDLSGGTFTISNLGMYGIDRFTALINPPEAAILAVGRIHKQVALKDDHPVEQQMLTLRLSVDHRILDGATAAPFLIDLKKTIENPNSIS